MKIYIASSEKHKGKVSEDIYMLDAYISLGYQSEILTLTEILNLAQPSDIVLLKSIWGYHVNHFEFLRQIEALRIKNITLVNDYDFIVWNIDKYKYLNEIRSLGIVPTLYLSLKAAQTLSQIENVVVETCKKFDAHNLVIKPCISESGNLTFKYENGGNNTAIISSLKDNKHMGFIAQPFRSSISEGELSVIVINGMPLYGIIRFPGILYQKLDQTYVELNSIPDIVLKKVDTLKTFFSENFRKLPVICRIDVLKTPDGYEILEVELIDPDLFLRNIPESIKQKVVTIIHDTIVK